MQNQCWLIPGALLSQKFLSFILLFVLHFFSFIYRNFKYVAVFRTVEIVKERSCAMPLLDILIYNKIIKQIVKPAVQFRICQALICYSLR